MSVAPTTASSTISSTMQGGDTPQGSFSSSSKYSGGKEGSSTFPPGSACKESQAVAMGKAVTFVGSDKACEGVQGITLVIGDTFHSVHSGFSHINRELGCNGEQGCCANNLALNAPTVG